MATKISHKVCQMEDVCVAKHAISRNMDIPGFEYSKIQIFKKIHFQEYSYLADYIELDYMYIFERMNIFPNRRGAQFAGAQFAGAQFALNRVLTYAGYSPHVIRPFAPFAFGIFSCHCLQPAMSTPLQDVCLEICYNLSCNCYPRS